MSLSLQNPWWQYPSAIEKDDKVSDALEKNPQVRLIPVPTRNYLFFGPRQVGKTTQIKLWIYDLIKSATPPQSILYFSCEPLREKNALINLVNEFDTLSHNISGKKYIFLDEITIIPQWEQELKFILDSPLSKNKIIIATGSNAIALKTGAERFPGRNIITALFLPLSFREYIHIFGTQHLLKKIETINFRWNDLGNRNIIINEIGKLAPFQKELMNHLNDYLKTGGFLKPIFEFKNTQRIHRDTYETYVKWILGDLSKLNRREDIFRSMIAGLLKKKTSKFSLNAFSREMAIPSHVTTNDYLQLLENLLLLKQLFQCDVTTLNTLYRKERKVYFRDPFLFSAFTGYSNGVYKNYSLDSEPYLIECLVSETLSRSQLMKPRKKESKKKMDKKDKKDKKKKIDEDTRKVDNENDTALKGDIFISSAPMVWFFIGKKEVDFVLRNSLEKNIANARTGIEVKWQNKVSSRDFHHANTFKHRIIVSKNTLSLTEETFILPACLFLALFSSSRNPQYS